MANQQILKLKPVCSFHLQLLVSPSNLTATTPTFVHVSVRFWSMNVFSYRAVVPSRGGWLFNELMTRAFQSF